MNYQPDALVGNRYLVRSALHSYRSTAGAGTYLHFANDERYEKRKVTIRTVRYTAQEMASGDGGIRSGRERLTRQVELMNRVDGIVFPEILDRFVEKNYQDVIQDETLRGIEPVLIYQYMGGEDLAALLQNIPTYFLHEKAQQSKDNCLWHVSSRRLAQFLRRLVLHLQTLLRAGIAHVDLNPSHILVSRFDEIPRLLGPGHLVSLNEYGLISTRDPSLRFTTAGFAAPELVTSAGGWGEGASGEAVMLYGVGALLSAILLGPNEQLQRIHIEEGSAGVMERIDRLEQNVRVDQTRGRASDFIRIIRRLLAPSPDERGSLAALEEELKKVSGDSRLVSRRVLECNRCSGQFNGRPGVDVFRYRKSEFMMCATCLTTSHQEISHTCGCGGSFTEKEGISWARRQVGEHPRRWCDGCRALRKR